jgi:crotonobetainyl-CoA:carnitine CoA-transferase CaiB-like acyl-CoA transferase
LYDERYTLDKPLAPNVCPLDPERKRTMPHKPASTALSHITVLDLTRVRSGPTCVRQLADWGANVIKIELPEAMDNDAPGGPRHGSDFQNLHRNKRAMTLDLKSPDGVGIFHRLAEKADVVVENFRPDVKERLGIGYKALAKINPRLIFASISGFGQDGPYATRPGFDQIAQGMGGLMSITGEPGRGPMRVGLPIADLSAGLFAAMGIMVAIIEREKSGRGQYVETSLLEAQIFMLDFQAARLINEKEVAKQAGNNHPTSIPTGVFKTKDGHINIATTGQKIWTRMCQAIGAPDLADKAAYKLPSDRSKNRDALTLDMEKFLAKKTSTQWVELLNEAGVPTGPIYNIGQMFGDQHVEHLGMVHEIETNDTRGKLKVLRQPVRLSRTPSRTVVAPPERGANTKAILKEFGFTAAEIKALEKKNVF